MGEMAQALQFDVLTPRQVSDEVYGALRAKILTCQLSPGERLDVDGIAQQLGVSRTPVKDALSRLSAERLIEIQPRRGTFVSPIRAVQVDEIFAVREALELKACELLADKLDDDLIDTLRQLNEELAKPKISLQDNARFDMLFHQLLVERCGNRRLLELYNDLNAHLQIARIHYRSDNWRARLAVARSEHLAIIQALENRNVKGAMAALKKHIQSSRDRMVSDIQAFGKE
jgi:DNA-binding GntR family transcriptional regulator